MTANAAADENRTRHCRGKGLPRRPNMSGRNVGGRSRSVKLAGILPSGALAGAKSGARGRLELP